MKVHYLKLYNMAHLSFNVFTASKGSNNYNLFNTNLLIYPRQYLSTYNKYKLLKSFIANDNSTLIWCVFVLV